MTTLLDEEGVLFIGLSLRELFSPLSFKCVEDPVGCGLVMKTSGMPGHDSIPLET